MGRFRLRPRCGNHIEKNSEGKPITYKSGDVVKSDRDLTIAFPGKFEVVLGGDASEDMPTAPNIPKSSKKKKITTSPKESVSEKVEIPESEHGVDVTKEFLTASEAKLKVFEKSKWFTVVDPDNNEVLNEKKLRRGKVEDFLADYSSPEDDAEDEEDEDEEDEDDED